MSISATEQVVYRGVGLGNAIAVAISWSVNQSIGWSFLHGIFGWFYVIYFHLCVRG